MIPICPFCKFACANVSDLTFQCKRHFYYVSVDSTFQKITETVITKKYDIIVAHKMCCVYWRSINRTDYNRIDDFSLVINSKIDNYMDNYLLLS